MVLEIQPEMVGQVEKTSDEKNVPGDFIFHKKTTFSYCIKL